ncbi:MAG: biotin/lipoyl-binding protein [Chloroflexota bacterium]
MAFKDKKSKKKSLVIWLAIIFILLLAGGGYAYYRLVYLPSQTVKEEKVVQTATVRRDDLILRASGAAMLVASDQRTFGFGASGKIVGLNVAVGDEVEEGQLLAQLDNSGQTIALQQAERTLTELTSPLAIAEAKQAVSNLKDTVKDVRNQLAYYISPNVLYWEDYRDAATVALNAAKEANDTAAIEAAEKDIERADLNLLNSWSVYKSEYVPDTFTVEEIVDRETTVTYIVKPTEEAIQDTRDTLYLARQRLIEAQYLVTALEEDAIPEGATGSGITQLVNAQISLEAAQKNLEATVLYAPIAGTVTSVSGLVGETAGSNFMTIVNFNAPQVQIYLDESDWENVAVGYDVEVVFDTRPDTIFTGKIIKVDPLLVQSGGSLIVQALAELDEDSLANIGRIPLSSEGSVDVISGRADAAMLIPVESLHDLGNGKYAVFVMKGGIPTMQEVEIGLIDIYYAQVISGLNIGDVVTTGIVETK